MKKGMRDFMVELFRAIIPSTKAINDNIGNTWRVHMGKVKYISNLVKSVVVDKKESLGFAIGEPPIKNDKFRLRLEVWKGSQRFDHHNYSMTFKPVIDVLSENGYFEDDCHKYCVETIITGGDSSNWNERAYRYDGDNLPDSIDKSWWDKNFAHNRRDIFIRLLVEYL